ncbi:MAG: MATE family efflux transporter [Gemmatimonadota bacterium]
MFIAQLAVVASSGIDTAMAGRLSAIDLAGVALGTNVYVSVYIAFIGVVTAVGPIAGHHFGAGRLHAIGHDVGQALWLAVLFSVIGIALLAWTDPWFALAKAPAEVTRVTSAYLLGIAAGLPAALGARVFVALNSAVSRPRITMSINLVALALKIPLNALFIHGAGPLPALGGAGCGVATAALSWLTLALSFAVWRIDPYFARFRAHRNLRWHGPQWTSQRELLKLGVPMGMAILFEVSSFTFMGILVARLGTQTLGAHQIVANVVSILFMVPLSIGFAAAALASQALGAGRPRDARRLTLRAVQLTLALALALAASVWLGRTHIVGFYTRDPEVARIALALLAFGTAFHVFDALQGVAFQTLRGYKVATAPMLIYGVCLWGIGIGGGFWVAYSATPLGAPMGAAGFWSAAIVSLGTTATLLVTLLFSVSSRHSRRPAHA